jgi:probable rRNA maturation factor
MLLTSFSLDRAELGVLLVNDRRMKELNRVHRNMDRTTDVLSFPLYYNIAEMPGSSEFLLGDIAINPHAAQRQAAAYGVSIGEEMRRLLIHGFLHLLGYDHERTHYRAVKMRKKEEALRDTLEALD